MRLIFLSLFLLNLSPLFASNEEKCFKENNAEICYQYGLELFMTVSSAKSKKGNRMTKDKAVRAFTHGCNNSNQQSCFELGQYHIQIDDKIIGKLILDRSCKEKHEPSCEALKKLK